MNWLENERVKAWLDENLQPSSAAALMDDNGELLSIVAAEAIKAGPRIWKGEEIKDAPEGEYALNVSGHWDSCFEHSFATTEVLDEYPNGLFFGPLPTAEETNKGENE